ncbi:DUF3800 domain-containing protein [Luteibacter sp.]|jgi:hypothetical protein|uniref:DUF3800 domain-containing protein n=1 Tax=Luteibacter sp. TaxID=1886636 RepID=UPI002F425E16
MDLYFDESGNTGTDLLNEAQPVAVLASTSLEEAACSGLLSPLLRQGQSEAKYSKLKGSHKGQSALLSLLRSSELNRESAKVMVADKRFYLTAHLVDKLIEPALLDAGIDAYAGDTHVSLARLLHFAGPHILPNGGWRKVLGAFEAVIRRQSKEAFLAYEQMLDRVVLPATDGKFGREAMLLYGTKGRAQEGIEGFEARAVFDPMPDLFIGVVSQWMDEHPGEFSVTHDASKPLAQREPFIRELMTPLAPRKFGYGMRKAELPLRISKLAFADSKQYPQIQLADVLAGASMDLMMATLKLRPETEFHKQLRNSQLFVILVDGIVAIREFGRANEPAGGEQNLVDGAAEFLAEAAARNARQGLPS